jgi:hypothetical protein
VRFPVDSTGAVTAINRTCRTVSANNRADRVPWLDRPPEASSRALFALTVNYTPEYNPETTDNRRWANHDTRSPTTRRAIASSTTGALSFMIVRSFRNSSLGPTCANLHCNLAYRMAPANGSSEWLALSPSKKYICGCLVLDAHLGSV